MATILQVIPVLGAGGAEQGCIDVAMGIVASGGRALVVSYGGNRVSELERIGATPIHLSVHSKKPWQLWKNISSLEEVIRQYRVDLVHARSRAPAWSAGRACRLANIPFVTTCHAAYNIENNLKRFYNSSIVRADRVIAISHYVSDYLRKNYSVDAQKIAVVPRGIHLEKFCPNAITEERKAKLRSAWGISKDQKVIFLPGRITRLKGHAVMIAAMALLHVQYPDWVCLLVGDSQGRTGYHEELQRLIHHHELDQVVKLTGACSDMPAAYAIASVAISSSIEPEGFGRVPVEAQAMGRPIIATEHGGVCETILPNETGWFVPPNDPQALAQTIIEVLTRENLYTQDSAAKAIAHVHQQFSHTTMIEKTLEVYNSLLSGDF